MKRCPSLVADWTLSEVIFDLESLHRQIKEYEDKSSTPNFWDDPESANKLFKKLTRLKNILAPYQALDKTQRDILELYEMLREDPSPEMEKEADQMAVQFISDLDKYELKTLLSGEHDANNAIVELSAGAGGDEATDWASLLFRMYQRWVGEKGYKSEILSETPGDVTGYRSISFSVTGEMRMGT